MLNLATETSPENMNYELHDIGKDTDSIIEMLRGIKKEDKSMNDAFGLAAR